MSIGAAFDRHNSRQDYATPRSLLDAVVAHFGVAFSVDLAADASNSIAPVHFSIEQDALSQDWSALHGALWLNPPFADIEPWAEKCAVSFDARRKRRDLRLLGWELYFLVPASVGSNWYARHVHGRAAVHFLSHRLSFDGKHPYPAVYGREPGYSCWRWNEPDEG